MRLPLIRLVDGSGGGGSVKTLEMVGYFYVPELHGFETTMKLMGHVPVVCACMGSVAGLGAVRVTISHFSLMIEGTSQLFVAGPPVVERGFGKPVDKNALGGHTSMPMAAALWTMRSLQKKKRLTASDDFFLTCHKMCGKCPLDEKSMTRSIEERKAC